MGAILRGWWPDRAISVENSKDSVRPVLHGASGRVLAASGGPETCPRRPEAAASRGGRERVGASPSFLDRRARPCLLKSGPPEGDCPGFRPTLTAGHDGFEVAPLRLLP